MLYKILFSIEAYRKGKKETEKKKNLEKRRAKLAQMLKEENNEYEVGLYLEELKWKNIASFQNYFLSMLNSY